MSASPYGESHKDESLIPGKTIRDISNNPPPHKKTSAATSSPSKKVQMLLEEDEEGEEENVFQSPSPGLLPTSPPTTTTPPTTLNPGSNFFKKTSHIKEPYGTIQDFTGGSPWTQSSTSTYPGPVPVAQSWAPSIGAGANTGAGADALLLKKINYMITLLEAQKDERTGHTMEEVLLYSFLGVGMIFLVDSFFRYGGGGGGGRRYVR
jgi:hypothetical protein